MKTFEEIGVCSPIRRAIEELGYEQPMPIQEQVIPYLLGTHNDIIALAQTGTGKTAAFGLPILQKVVESDDRDCKDVKAVILAPTRELCLQICDDLRDYARYLESIHIVAVYGGADIRGQIRALQKGAQIIVATPGRLIDLMERGIADLTAVENVVLDEADEMLNMGFTESIDAILAGVPDDRNTLLFSATMGPDIERIAKSYLHDYKEIVVGSRNEGAEHVNHIYYLVRAADKYAALKRVVDYYPRIYGIIFCRTRMETQEVADRLIRDGYNAEALHGDLSQGQRDLTMQKFRQRQTQLLVATDVAARGLDVDDLTHVINYGLPDDVENYTHRSGRTGRAGKKGTSISIIHIREKHKVRRIEDTIGKKFENGQLPEPREICTKQLYHVMDQLEHVEVNDEQIEPFMPEVLRKLEWLSKEDLVARIVQKEFGHFLKYYENEAPIEKPEEHRKEAREGKKSKQQSSMPSVEEGYTRLWLNLGKRDKFFPKEIISLVNKFVKGRVDIGHIELQQSFSLFEVPEEDADRVIASMKKAKAGSRNVVVRLDEGPAPTGREKKVSKKQVRSQRNFDKKQPKRKEQRAPRGERPGKALAKKRFTKDDWKQFFD